MKRIVTEPRNIKTITRRGYKKLENRAVYKNLGDPVTRASIKQFYRQLKIEHRTGQMPLKVAKGWNMNDPRSFS